MPGLHGGMRKEIDLCIRAGEVFALVKGNLAVPVGNGGFKIHGGVFGILSIIKTAGEKAVEVLILGIDHDLGAALALLAHPDGIAQLLQLGFLGRGKLARAGSFLPRLGGRRRICLDGRARLDVKGIRNPARGITLWGKYGLDLGRIWSHILVPLRAAVLNGEVGEEVAVDKQRQGTLRLIFSVEGNSGELVISVFFGIALRGHAQAVAGSGGVTSRGLGKAFLQAWSLLILGLLAAYLNRCGLRFIGDELAVFAARTGAVGEAVTPGLGKQRGVVSVRAGNEIGRMR